MESPRQFRRCSNSGWPCWGHFGPRKRPFRYCLDHFSILSQVICLIRILTRCVTYRNSYSHILRLDSWYGFQPMVDDWFSQQSITSGWQLNSDISRLAKGMNFLLGFGPFWQLITHKPILGFGRRKNVLQQLRIRVWPSLWPLPRK